MSNLLQELILAKSSSRELNVNTPINLAGYAKQTRKANKIDAQLELNIILIAGVESGPQILIISLDTLYFSKTIVEKISEKYLQYQILFCPSHTHFAPNLDPNKCSLGEFNKQFHDETLEIIDREIQLLEQVDYRLCRLDLYKTNANGAVNRRKFRLMPSLSRTYSHITMSPNYKYQYANLLRLVKFFTLTDSETGKCMALVWNWACHPTGYPLNNVSSDFIGHVRISLRAALENIPVVFMQGFSGDIRPDDGDISIGWFLRIKLYLFGLGFRKMSLEKYSEWCEDIAKSIISTLNSSRGSFEIKETKELHFTEAAFNIAEYIPSLDSQMLVIKKIETSLLKIVSINAEATFEWNLALSKIFSGELWTVGCEGDAFGYLPYGYQISQGGYEVNGYMEVFGKAKCKVKNYTNDLIRLFNAI